MLTTPTARSTAVSSVHADTFDALLSHFVHDHTRRDAKCHGSATKRALRLGTGRPLLPVGTLWVPRSPHRPAYPARSLRCAACGLPAWQKPARLSYGSCPDTD